MIETSSVRVDTAELEDFRRRGCAVRRGVLPPETIRAAAPALRAYVYAKRNAISEAERACGASTGDTMFSLGDAPPAVAEFVTWPLLGEIAATFLEVEAVRVLHFVGFFKEPGGPATPLHQDLTYVPLATDRFLTLWIPLSDVTEEMGPIVYAEGSHLGGALADPNEARRYRITRNGPLGVGDLSMHLGWTVHGALKNTSDRMREAMAIAYYADGARIDVRGEARFMQALMADYFAGLGPGDAAASPLNPVVYRRPHA